MGLAGERRIFIGREVFVAVILEYGSKAAFAVKNLKPCLTKTNITVLKSYLCYGGL